VIEGEQSSRDRQESNAISATTPTAAAGVLLQAGAGSPELFLVRRSETLRFFGGYYAFPGGKVAPTDPSETDDLGRRWAATRELFEETGVLLARGADRSFPPTDERLVSLRRALLEERLSFDRVLADLQVNPCPEDLVLLGNLVTPPFTAIRFDTTFYLAELPPGQRAEVWPGELDEGHWTSPAAMLERWTRGEYLVAPPTLALLQAARLGQDLPQRLPPLLASWNTDPLPPMFFAPEVQMLPLHAAVLPPSTHTNAYLVGRDRAYLIDPGPEEAEEQQRLFTALDVQHAFGRRLAAILLTHQHPDHIGAAVACSQRYSVPVWAHPLTAESLRGKVNVSRLLQDGELLDLVHRPDGRGRWGLRVLHSPGHAAGHVAFYEPYYRLLFAGDLVSTQTSVVIAAPDGDLAVYLESLRRARTLDCRLLLPAHGSPDARASSVIDQALAHRAKREDQLLAALARGPRSPAELVHELYRGVPSSLWRLAELQVLAGLRKLQREGRAEREGAEESQPWCLVSRD
jgi:glyoxylase-like metal-dependent hydrolase (beta-lactamase superfamily II)/8-oxo-dGTP pyrophosphatase MutT (NUDIX family)